MNKHTIFVRDVKSVQQVVHNAVCFSARSETRFALVDYNIISKPNFIFNVHAGPGQLKWKLALVKNTRAASN